jgi:hypothetical protein
MTASAVPRTRCVITFSSGWRWSFGPSNQDTASAGGPRADLDLLIACTASLHDCLIQIGGALLLWPGEGRVTLGTENVTVEVRDPLSATRSDIEVPNGGLNMRQNALPIELRVLLNEVGRRLVAKLLVHADFFELIIKGVAFRRKCGSPSCPMRSAGSQKRTLFVVRIVDPCRSRTPRELDRVSNPACIENVASRDAIHDEQLGPARRPATRPPIQEP